MKKKEGVSLIELIVSIVIFGVIIVGVIVFNTNNTRVTVRSERSAKRVLLQEKTIEEFRGWLKSASVPGSRFDGIWSDSAVGDILIARTDPATGMSVKLEIMSFIPDQSAGVADAGVQLKVRVLAEDTRFGIQDESVIYISRHD
jgi:prepilin-type N-terminal cleavage/methylation domain-containing protein